MAAITDLLSVKSHRSEQRLELPDVEVLPFFGALEIDQGWEEQDHVSSFVHDGCTAVGTADLARQLVNGGLL